MKKINEKTFKKLATYSSDPCVSIYIPTHRSGQEVNEGLDIITFKNKLQNIEKQLVDYISGPTQIKKFLKPAYDLLKDRSFWNQQSEGLCVFIGSGLFEYFTLPIKVEELSLVGTSLHVSPLIPIATDNTKFFILALSQNNVRLFSATHFKVSEINIQGKVPVNIKEALMYDDPQKESQFLSGGALGSGAVFFGNDNGKELRKDNVRRFCHMVDHGILQVIGSTNAPLVVAAVEYEHSIYRDITHFTHMIPEGIIGNPEMKTAEELHQEGWKLVEPYFNKALMNADEIFGNLSDSEKTSCDLEQIIAGSMYSKVDKLFLVHDCHVWGYYDKKNNKVHMHNSYNLGDEDLLNTAAVNTFLNGGEVYYINKDQMPFKLNNAAAVFRYPGKI